MKLSASIMQNKPLTQQKMTFKKLDDVFAESLDRFPKYEVRKVLEEHRVQDYRPVTAYNPQARTRDVYMNQVVVSPEQMRTAGVNTCSTVRATCTGENKLLGHIGIKTPPDVIESGFKQLGVEKFKSDPNARISIKSGHDRESIYTTGIIVATLDKLGLTDKIQYDGMVEDGHTEVGVNCEGFFEQQWGQPVVDPRRTLYAAPRGGVVMTELPKEPIANSNCQIALPASRR